MKAGIGTGTTLIAIACGVVAVAVGGAPSGGSHVSRAALLAGSALFGLGAAMLLRRRFAAAPPNGHATPFAFALDSFLTSVEDHRRFARAGIVCGLGMYSAFVLGPTGVAAGGLGVLCLGIFSSAASALGCLVGWVCGLGWPGALSKPFESRAVDVAAIGGFMVLAIQSLLVMPQTIRAWREQAPWRRVRFEIGGLGTRVEDTTPLGRQDHSLLEALLTMLVGAALVILNRGAAALGDACLAVVIAPALASLAMQVGSPIVLLGLLSVARGTYANVAFVVTASTIVLAMEVQRLVVLRGERPRAAPKWIALGSFVASALGAALLETAPESTRWPRFAANVESFGWIAFCALGIAVFWAMVAGGSEDDLSDPATRASETPRPAGLVFHVPALVVLGIAIPSVVVGLMIFGATLGTGSRSDEGSEGDWRPIREWAALVVVAVALAAAIAFVGA